MVDLLSKKGMLVCFMLYNVLYICEYMYTIYCVDISIYGYSTYILRGSNMYCKTLRDGKGMLYDMLGNTLFKILTTMISIHNVNFLRSMNLEVQT